MEDLEKTQEKLITEYQNWWIELKGLSKEKYNFTDKEYSLPYFTFVPDFWYKNNAIKVLIIGEEARGDWDVDDWRNAGIDKIMAWAKNHQKEQLSNKTKSVFWQRVKKIKNIKPDRIVCAWTNIDKIHHNGTKNCSLNKEERILLHSTEIKILAKEIEYFNPDIVVFFGWSNRKEAIKAELPKLYNKFFVKESYEYEKLFEYIYRIQDGTKTYIFTAHPGWHGKYKPSDYEENVYKAVEMSIK